MTERLQQLLKKLKNGLVDYCRVTKMHGFKYVVEGRNVFERLFWIIFIIFAFTMWYNIVWNAFQHWEDNPVETTIDAVGLPVHLLPFPAITVCDTKSLQMPRRNRWMFVETLLNSLELTNPKELITEINPSMRN